MTFQPIRIDRRLPAADEERTPIFYVTDADGQEKEYTAPAQVPAGHAIQALTIAATRGYVAASGWIVLQALGQEAVNVLYDCPQLTRADAQAMMQKLGELYFGQVEALALGEKEEDKEPPGN